MTAGKAAGAHSMGQGKQLADGVVAQFGGLAVWVGILKASERWTHPIQNWNLTLSQLAIHFPGRLDEHISL